MHVCLFDIDGTLLNTGGAGQAALEEALVSVFGLGKPSSGISTAGRTDRAIAADFFSFHGVEPSEDNFERFLGAYLEHLPGHLARLPGRVFPGIVELLAELANRPDVMVGLLTGNFREGARLKLEHYKLHQHFDFGGFGDRHHHRDDVAREALEEVHRRTNGTTIMEKVWVIGDTPADVQCGRAIGANVVAVATGVFTREQLEAAGPDHLFDDFADPRTMLELLG